MFLSKIRPFLCEVRCTHSLRAPHGYIMRRIRICTFSMFSDKWTGREESIIQGQNRQERSKSEASRRGLLHHVEGYAVYLTLTHYFADMWSHFRLLWLVTPKTLWESTVSRVLLSMVGACWDCDIWRRKQTIISLHFLGFSTMLFWVVQGLIDVSSSGCRTEVSRARTIFQIVMSSAYFFIE